MAINRVQFQPGLSIHEFTALYGTREKCEAAVIHWRWPEKYVCPSCGHIDPMFLLVSSRQSAVPTVQRVPLSVQRKRPANPP